MSIIILSNVYTANKAYLNMYLSYENTYSVTSSIIAQLQNTPGYTVESKVALVGEWPEPAFYDIYFADLYDLMGVGGISVNTYSIEYFFEYYHGFAINLVAEEEKEAISNNPEFTELSPYPNYGYIKRIDDIFVVKLSESFSS